MQMLGKGLKDLPRDEIVLATKFGRYGPNLFDFSAERVRGVQQFLSCYTPDSFCKHRAWTLCCALWQHHLVVQVYLILLYIMYKAQECT